MGRILEYVILQNKYVHLNNKNLRVQGLNGSDNVAET